MSESDVNMTDALNGARDLGTEHGKSAASWAFDGYTSEETYRGVIAGLEDGDPGVYDMFREPSFSGEYADDYSERDLCRDLGIDYDVSGTAEIDEITDAYLNEAHASFWDEVERMARIALS